MSGGTFNYLYCKNYIDIVENYNDSESFLDMIKELKHRGFDDIATDAKKLFNDIKKIDKELNERLETFKDIFHAVEYHDSNDWGEKSVFESVNNYRAKKNKCDGNSSEDTDSKSNKKKE